MPTQTALASARWQPNQNEVSNVREPVVSDELASSLTRGGSGSLLTVRYGRRPTERSERIRPVDRIVRRTPYVDAAVASLRARSRGSLDRRDRDDRRTP